MNTWDYNQGCGQSQTDKWVAFVRNANNWWTIMLIALSCKYTPRGIPHWVQFWMVKLGGRSAFYEGLGTPIFKKTQLLMCGPWSSSRGCHFTLVGFLSPRRCLLKDAVNISSANENFLSPAPSALVVSSSKGARLLGDCPTQHSVEWSPLRIW